MSDAVVIALVSGLFSLIASYVGATAAVKVHLRYLRRDVDAAHKRLDVIGAPGAWVASPDA